jgi:hypothetical protein
VGQVQPALAGDQELAADRTLGVIKIDLQAGRAQLLGGEQAGRAAADDGDTGGGIGDRGAGSRGHRDIMPSRPRRPAPTMTIGRGTLASG